MSKLSHVQVYNHGVTNSVYIAYYDIFCAKIDKGCNRKRITLNHLRCSAGVYLLDFFLLRYSVLFTVESLCLLYLLVISCFRR